MNEYQKEQAEALTMVRRHLKTLSRSEQSDLKSQIADYMQFRQEVDAFLEKYFGHLCNQKCFQSRLSACCSRDGIITFFADVLINALGATEADFYAMSAAIKTPLDPLKCIYLGKEGCVWRVKPIVCQMFLCNSAKKEVFAKTPQAEKKWAELQERKKRFIWPDRPVLFDDLEHFFMGAGYSSPLMYLHNSPGLLRVKKQANKNKPR